MRQAQEQIKQLDEQLLEKSWKFLALTATISMEGSTNGLLTYLSTIRALMNKALQLSVQDSNEAAVVSILQFSHVHRLTLKLADDELELLVQREAYDMISFLVSASVQLERKKSKTNISRVTKQLAQQNIRTGADVSRVTISLQEVVATCYQL